jgi:hypothetical protein
MYRFRLSSDQVQLEVIGNGRSHRLPFQVIGPTTEVAFLEELIEESLGSLTLNPAELFGFLSQDPWVHSFFKGPELIEGDLQAVPPTTLNGNFHHLNLGNKLVHAGVLELEELETLLEDYRPFAASQRFGEFLRLNMRVPPQVLELLLNPGLFDSQGFNEQRLGEKLVELGCISPEQLQHALHSQRERGQVRIGEILAEQGAISSTMARFFSEARITASGEIEYHAD